MSESDIKKPNVIPSRRSFMTGAAALTGGAAILASGRPDLMVNWTRTRWGADDLEMWQQQCRCLPTDSPLRPLAAAEAGRLEHELAVPGR